MIKIPKHLSKKQCKKKENKGMLLLQCQYIFITISPALWVHCNYK